MQCFGHQLLTGSRFAIDEYIDIRVRQPAYGSKYLLHSGRTTNHLGGHFVVAAVVSNEIFLGYGKRPACHCHYLINIKGLGQIFKSAILIRGYGVI